MLDSLPNPVEVPLPSSSVLPPGAPRPPLPGMDYNTDVRTKVLTIGDRAWGIYDLLEHFIQQESGPYFLRCSDLHLKVGEPIRCRIDGDLETLQGCPPLDAEQVYHLTCPLLSSRQIRDYLGDNPDDIDCSLQWNYDDRIVIRVNAFHDSDGPALAIRLLKNNPPPIDEIGFRDPRVWQAICNLRQGLVLVSGVTGSGKSTTVASLVRHINEHERVRIITLEDPIEYRFKSRKALISQREMGRQLSTFAAGLRSALREDPDVIFVGEIRDESTAALAVAAAQTGHVVIATTHSKDTTSALTRLVDLYPANRSREIASNLAHSLAWVVAQKLVPRIGGGRVLVTEVLKATPVICTHVRNQNWAQIYTVLSASQGDGMLTMERCLQELARNGTISKAEAVANANAAEHLIV